MQRDWTQEKNCLNAWILKKDDAITRKYQWNHRFLWILSNNFGFWTQTNPNNMIGERLSKNSCDWVASVCFYRKKNSLQKKVRYRRMVVWKRTQKNTCCLLLARFLFVKLFTEVASLFTWRGRREGISWVGERISWKFGDFLSCIQYIDNVWYIIFD